MLKDLKKPVFLFVLFVISQLLMAQAPQPITFAKNAFVGQYPVAVNEQITTVLIFPAPIATDGVDLGSTDIIAGAVDGVSNILKIKASAPNTAATNLTVVTTDGEVYSFWVSYALKADSRPIDLMAQKDQEKILAKFKDRTLTDQQIADLAKHVATRKAFLNTAKARSFRITTRLKGIYIASDVVFFKIALSNKTDIDYKADFIRYYIRNKKRAKRTADHEQELKPLYTYYTHGDITAGRTSQEIIMAFPRFTIADQKNFLIQLFEKNGDRNLQLKIDGNDIIKAQPLNPITE